MSGKDLNWIKVQDNQRDFKEAPQIKETENGVVFEESIIVVDEVGEGGGFVGTTTNAYIQMVCLAFASVVVDMVPQLQCF